MVLKMLTETLSKIVFSVIGQYSVLSSYWLHAKSAKMLRVTGSFFQSHGQISEDAFPGFMQNY
jgi:hypothetical protein